MWQSDTKAVQSTTHHQITNGPNGERFSSSSSIPAVIHVSEEMQKGLPSSPTPAQGISRMFCRSCCHGQLQITQLFLGPVCCCRLVWLVGLQFYNHPWHLLLKPCPWYLWLKCCCFSVSCTKFILLRALSEIPVQEVCSMAFLRRARIPSERRQKPPISKGTHRQSGSA